MSDRLNILKDPDIYQFFSALFKECKEDGVYSVIETAEKMGVPYAKVQQWASVNEDWKDTLEICRCHCAHHALQDWAFFRLPNNLGLKYCLENDDEFAAHN